MYSFPSKDKGTYFLCPKVKDGKSDRSNQVLCDFQLRVRCSHNKPSELKVRERRTYLSRETPKEITIKIAEESLRTAYRPGDTIRVRACEKCMPVRCMSVRCMPVRCMPARCMSVRCMPAIDHAY